MQRKLWWGVALYLAVACTDRPDASGAAPYKRAAIPQPLLRDSSGVRIIEYPTLGPAIASLVDRRPNPMELQLNQLPPAFDIADEPYLDLGGLTSDSAEEFDARNAMLQAVTLSDGTIVANDFTRLMYFAKDGRFLRSAGRRGNGPGEFMQTRDLCLVEGDLVLATNFADQRIAVFDADGKLVQAAPRPGRVPSGGCTPEGYLVVRDEGDAVVLSDSVDWLVPHRIVRLDGSTVASIGSLPAKTRMGATTPYVVVHDEEIVVGNGRTFEVRVYDRAGNLRQVSRLLRQTPPVTDAEWKARLEKMRPMGSPEAIARFRSNVLAAKPDRDPAFSQIRVDPSHRIWVSDYQSNHLWTVIDRDGFLLGRVELLGRLEARRGLAGLGRDHIAIHYRDDDGALHLAFHRIASSSPVSASGKRR